MAPATSTGSRKRARLAMGQPSTSGPSSEAPSVTGRNKTESNRALVRDKELCVVTGTSCPQVCHIVPFSWTESQKNYNFVGGAIFGPFNVLWNTNDLPREAWMAL